MNAIEEYVDRMFGGLPKTKAVLDMKRSILENMQERYEDLTAQGKSENEALGAVISQFGNIEEIKKELGVENGAEELKRNGILETLFAYFSPDVLFWRMLIHRSLSEAVIIFAALAVELSLGFAYGLWAVSWLAFPVAGLVVLILSRRGGAEIDYCAEVGSHYGALETVCAYFMPGVLFWRILIRKNGPEAVAFFTALAVHLLLGFLFTLWSVSWLTLLAAGVFALLYERREKVSCVPEG